MQRKQNKIAVCICVRKKKNVHEQVCYYQQTKYMHKNMKILNNRILKIIIRIKKKKNFKIISNKLIFRNSYIKWDCRHTELKFAIKLFLRIN